MPESTIKKPTIKMISFVGISWALLILTMSYYCYLYGVVYAKKDDFVCYLKWALWSWCVWLILIPITYKEVKNIFKATNGKKISSQLFEFIKLGAVLCISALLIQLAGTSLIDGNWLQDVFYYLPTNIKIFIMSVLVTLIFIKNDAVKQTHTTANKDQILRCLNIANEETFVPIHEIDWLTAYGNYVQIHKNKTVYLIRTTMKELDEKLNPTDFIRIHRSHIVNRNVINSVKYKNGQTTLNTVCGNILPVSRSYKNCVLNQQL